MFIEASTALLFVFIKFTKETYHLCETLPCHFSPSALRDSWPRGLARIKRRRLTNTRKLVLHTHYHQEIIKTTQVPFSNSLWNSIQSSLKDIFGRISYIVFIGYYFHNIAMHKKVSNFLLGFIEWVFDIGESSKRQLTFQFLLGFCFNSLKSSFSNTVINISNIYPPIHVLSCKTLSTI